MTSSEVLCFLTRLHLKSSVFFNMASSEVQCFLIHFTNLIFFTSWLGDDLAEMAVKSRRRKWEAEILRGGLKLEHLRFDNKVLRTEINGGDRRNISCPIVPELSPFGMTVSSIWFHSFRSDRFFPGLDSHKWVRLFLRVMKWQRVGYKSDGLLLGCHGCCPISRSSHPSSFSQNQSRTNGRPTVRINTVMEFLVSDHVMSFQSQNGLPDSSPFQNLLRESPPFKMGLVYCNSQFVRQSAIIGRHWVCHKLLDFSRLFFDWIINSIIPLNICPCFPTQFSANFKPKFSFVSESIAPICIIFSELQNR